MIAELLPVQRVDEVEEQQSVPWLIDGLWADQGVGFLCGSPKSNKTWLALDLALSVATRTPALGRYGVSKEGGVLLLAAEDSPQAVRQRLHGMAHRRGLSLRDVHVNLVLERSLRLESQKDQSRLLTTVARYRPKLLVLDPFVRLASIDENSSHEVSAVLGYLRAMQTQHQVAILVVHHARKANGNAVVGGLALRGSGDLWAWSDTNLFLSRKHDRLLLTVEHRGAPAPEPVALELCCEPDAGPYLRLTDEPVHALEQSMPICQRVIDALTAAGRPCRLDDLRAQLRVRMQTLVDTLRDLASQRRVLHGLAGWELCAAPTRADEKTGETDAGSAEAQPA